jgi:hypothetical protein
MRGRRADWMGPAPLGGIESAVRTAGGARHGVALVACERRWPSARSTQ